MNASSSKRHQSSAYLIVQELDLTLVNKKLQFSNEAPYLPDLSSIHGFNPERYPFLLESVAKSTSIPGSDANLGQFDILFAYPQHVHILENVNMAEMFVQSLQTEFAESKVDNIVLQNTAGEWLPQLELPFKGGWFVYFSYDYAQVVEPVLKLPKNKFPLAHIARMPAAIINDHQNNRTWLIAEKGHENLLSDMQGDIQNCVLIEARDSKLVSASPSDLVNPLNVLSESLENKTVKSISATEEPPQQYLDGVEAIKEYILAGDVFQVNLSRNWKIELSSETSYLSVYHALRQSNPAPFAVLANFIDSNHPHHQWQLMSSSPERLVKYQYPWVETRPIAGTRKRGSNPETDKALVEELIKHPKERAEHIMLIDLERNDLGRICQPGTVEVNDLMVVETYEHVHHIVSNVRGKLRDGFSPLDIVHALFPGGTITGCPKIRCMQIVAELEQAPREAYTGSLGYINLDGSLDLNILIRTMIQYQDNHTAAGDHENSAKKFVEFRAGAGIVADSQADFELVETRHKAKGLLRAFTQAEGGK